MKRSHYFVCGGKKMIFVLQSENRGEDKQLEVLVRETNIIVKISPKTGLYILAEFVVEDRKAIIMCLCKDSGPEVKLSQKEIEALIARICGEAKQ